MPEFILTTRGDLPNYYVSYRNPLTGKYGTKKSTGTSDKRQAEKIAYTWLISGEFEKRVTSDDIFPELSGVIFPV